MQRIMDGEIGLQVAVGFLSRADKVNHTVAICFQLGILLRGQHVGCALQYLVNLCVIIRVA